MTLKEAEVVALSTLKQVMEEKVRHAVLLHKNCMAAIACQCMSVLRSDSTVSCLSVTCTLRVRPCQGLYIGLQVTPTNVDIASVAPKYHLYTKEEIEDVISRL